MSSPIAVDALLLLATALAAKRRPAAPGEIVAGLDLIEPELPAVAELSAGFARLGESGLLLADDGRLALSAAAERLIEKLPRKGEAADRLPALQTMLAAYRPAAPGSAVVIGVDELRAAMLAQRAAVASGAKNLLVPKPKPEAAKARPGQRQRKPLPKSRKR